MLEKPPVTYPWKPGALWNTEYTYMVWTIITPNFIRKSTTTYTKRKVAKARPGSLEQILLSPPTETHLGFQGINEFMFYTNLRIIAAFTKSPCAHLRYDGLEV